MSEPDNIVLQHLRDIRGRLDAIEERLGAKIDAVADRVDHIELKLDGLTHAVIAGFGSIVHELDGLKDRVQRLEREKAQAVVPFPA